MDYETELFYRKKDETFHRMRDYLYALGDCCEDLGINYNFNAVSYDNGDGAKYFEFIFDSKQDLDLLKLSCNIIDPEQIDFVFKVKDSTDGI